MSDERCAPAQPKVSAPLRKVLKRRKRHQVVMVATNYLVALGLAPAIRVVSEHDTQLEADTVVKALEQR
jgi:hypothetical protein